MLGIGELTMTDKKLTDNEIMSLKKAMFILRHGSAEGEHKYFEAIDVIEKEINRQKAEIEELNLKCSHIAYCHDKLKHAELPQEIEFAKAEAIKEFAETYKNQIKNYTGMFTDEGFMVSLEAVLSAVDFVKDNIKEIVLAEKENKNDFN